jgi:uncharacterized protein YyaL (SSP411 family)
MERDLLAGSGNGHTVTSFSNRLIHEKSPYLLQHAANPIEWYPWGEEAFDRAAHEDKPVFLSIGYATCHWCHVMAHESFEDPDVAELLNRDFISIKVDREERPDIDSIYMSVCQMVTGQGGWPLTIIMTPDKKPFFAATYLPKERRFSIYGLLEILPRIVQAWRHQRPELLRSSEKIISALQGPRPDSPGQVPDATLLDDGYEELVLRFDPEYGGFGDAPKFPTPHVLLFLLRYWKRTGKKRALKMAVKTLDALRDGGICDQIGGGFHRYSTDAQWRVPHFEKMLYDQALLLMAYTEAFHAKGYDRYRHTAEEIIAYVLRDLPSPEGAFISAEDADNSGGEGAFYLWTYAELEAVLGPEDRTLAARLFSVAPSGNWSDFGHGDRTNILYRSVPLSNLATSLGMPEPELSARLDSLRARLFVAREKRPRPSRDDKVLADWNGLFIAALAKAARVLGNAQYLSAAERAMTFLFRDMRTAEGGLLHRYRDGEAAIPAFADDYAFVILGLIELYETTFDTHYLSDALALNMHFQAHFLDPEQGGYFSVSDEAEVLFARKKEIYDGAIPSANSVACENLIRLSRLTGDMAHEEHANSLARHFGSRVKDNPAAYAWFLCAIDWAAGHSQEIVIAGDTGAPDTERMIAAVRSRYLPNCTVLFRSTSEPATALVTLAPFTKDLVRKEGKATAYVCSAHTCSIPITDMDALEEVVNR